MPFLILQICDRTWVLFQHLAQKLFASQIAPLVLVGETEMVPMWHSRLDIQAIGPSRQTK